MTTFWKNELRAGTRFALRENPLARHLLADLRANEALNAPALQEVALRHLQRSMRHAIAHLPAYAHIDPAFPLEHTLSVLRDQFPIIDKLALLQQRARFYPRGGVRRPWEAVGKTSGTTGTPLSVWRSARSVLMENAFLHRHWAWSGYRHGMTRASLRGDMVVPLERRSPPFWFWNRYDRQLLLSSRHLTEACVDAMIDALEQHAPVLLQAYPSTAYALAGFLARRGRFLRIPYVYTASEPLYPHQRELILERLGCTVMDMYGMAERVAFATECEFGAMHINPDYSHVEIVDEHGQPTSGYGSVVGTTFHNLAQPLLRYRLSDQTRWKPGHCPCGRHFPMIEGVTGKLEDSISGGDGTPVSPSVLTFAFKGVENILKSQVAQVAPGRWEIRLVPAPAFSDADRLRLVDNVHHLVDASVHIDVVLKQQLPNTAAGKFRWVVNEMSTGSSAAPGGGISAN